MMEMSKIVPHLLRRFNFEFHGDWEVTNHWLVGYKGLNAKVTRRIVA
jgi:hypothetical protein